MKLKRQNKTRLEIPYNIFYKGIFISANTPFMVDDKDIEYLKTKFDAEEVDVIEVNIPIEEEIDSTIEKESKKNGK